MSFTLSASKYHENDSYNKKRKSQENMLYCKRQYVLRGPFDTHRFPSVRESPEGFVKGPVSTSAYVCPRLPLLVQG